MSVKKEVTFDDGSSATLTTLVSHARGQPLQPSPVPDPPTRQASSTNSSTFYATDERGPLPDADAEHQDHLFRIRKDGYTILRGCWDAGTCAAARARLDEMHRELEPDAEPGSAFSAAHLYNKGEVFEGVYQDARLLRIVRHFLGDDATIMSLGDNAINGVITPPRPGDQPDVISGLHNDGSLTGAFQGVGTPADDSRKIVSHVLCEHSNARSATHHTLSIVVSRGPLLPTDLQAIWCLSPFSKERGGTSFVCAHAAPPPPLPFPRSAIQPR